MTQVVILAAGAGTRLYPFTEVVPKIMFPVGREGIPLCQKIIQHCYKHNFSDFLFCLNTTTGRQVMNYLGNGSKLEPKVDIDYSFSDVPLGTAGELINAKHKIKNEFLLYYGDTLCKTDLTGLIEQHNRQHDDLTIVTNINIDIPVGYVEYIDTGKLIKIQEKPKLSTLFHFINDTVRIQSGGILPIFYISKGNEFLNHCSMKMDIIKDIIPSLLKKFNISVYEDKNPFLDIGTWKNFELAKMWDRDH